MTSANPITDLTAATPHRPDEALALFTFGIASDVADASAWRDFGQRARRIFGAASAADGYLGHAEPVDASAVRATSLVGEDHGAWGPYTIPTKLPGLEDVDAARVIQTLSLWRDLSSARAFVYRGFHADALRHRADWFAKGAWPGHVLWPVAAGSVPTWSDGARRLEQLGEEGATAAFFTFGSPGRGFKRSGEDAR